MSFPVALPLAVAAPTPCTSESFIHHVLLDRLRELFTEKLTKSLKLPHDPVYQRQSGREPFNLSRRQTTHLRFPSQNEPPPDKSDPAHSLFAQPTLSSPSPHSKSPTQYEHIK